MLTHWNLVSNILATGQRLPLSSSDVSLSFLPLSHIFQRHVDYAAFTPAQLSRMRKVPSASTAICCKSGRPSPPESRAFLKKSMPGFCRRWGAVPAFGAPSSIRPCKSAGNTSRQAIPLSLTVPPIAPYSSTSGPGWAEESGFSYPAAPQWSARLRISSGPWGFRFTRAMV